MKSQPLPIVQVLIALLCATLSASAGAKDADVVAGYLEKVWLGDGDIAFEAKLDTGAKSSSLNAARAETFQRNKKTWVRINLTNRWNQSYQLERPVKKTVRIRRAGAPKTRRFIIDLKLCVGGHTAVTEVSLADRTGQSYQLLIGRKFLAGRILVDSGQQFIVSKLCGKKGKQ